MLGDLKGTDRLLVRMLDRRSSISSMEEEGLKESVWSADRELALSSGAWEEEEGHAVLNFSSAFTLLEKLFLVGLPRLVG